MLYHLAIVQRCAALRIARSRGRRAPAAARAPPELKPPEQPEARAPPELQLVLRRHRAWLQLAAR